MKNSGSTLMINRRVLLSGFALLPALFNPARAIAQAQPATGSSLDSGKELVEDAVRAYGTDTTPMPLPTITLQPSGSIKVSADNQVIENKLITGKITVNGKSAVTIRNCQINHPGGIGIDVTNCADLNIQDCLILNTNHSTGQAQNPDESKSIQLNGGGPYTIHRVTVSDMACGIYAYQTAQKVTVSFFEGHNARSPGDRWGGNLMQFNKCTGGATVEDFSVENESTNSRTGDNINLFTCASGSYVFRRGLVDGNNHPAGCGFMIESTSGVLVEDVDMLHMGNGGPGVFSGAAQPGIPGTSSNTIYRRIRIKDTIQADQGRGPALSGYTTYTSSPGCINTKFEQCKHFNVNLGSLAWDVSTMTTRDWANVDFTPRAPIRNKFAWLP
jgi:Right handed beta helix region